MVMDQKGMVFVLRIRYPVIAEGHIPSHTVEEAVRIPRGLKAPDLDHVLRIQLPCDPPGDTVQLNTIHLEALHPFRDQPREVPNPADRFCCRV